MQQSKLLDLLKGFSTREFSRFSEYIHSPFFNKHQNTLRLFEFVALHRKNLNHPDLAKERAFAHVFPNEHFQEQKIKDVMSYLTKHAERFLIEIAFEEQKAAQQILLLGIYRDRKLHQYFLSAEADLRHFQEKTRHSSSEWYLHQFRLEHEADQYFISGATREKNESLNRKMQHFDVFYLSGKLKAFCEMLNRGNIINQTYDFHLKEEIIQHVANNQDRFKEHPLVTAYFLIFQMLTQSENQENFFRLMELLARSAHIFQADEAREMYEYGKNFCIKQINSGNPRFLDELFQVYCRLIENGLIYQGQYLSQWDYKNIVTVGLRLQQFDWVGNFIETQRKFLPLDQQENAYRYNMATLHYALQQYDEAQELLRDVEFTDLYYGIGGKTTLLKIYYETNQHDLLISLIDTFQTYLRRNKLISNYQYKVNNNLLRFTRRVANLRQKRDYLPNEQYEKEWKQAMEALDATRDVTNIGWVREKLLEIKP